MADQAQTRVIVHPNNPDGRLWSGSDLAATTIIDESFCDVTPKATLIAHHFPAGTRKLGLLLNATWPLGRYIALALASRIARNGDSGKHAAKWRGVCQRRAQWRNGWSSAPEGALHMAARPEVASTAPLASPMPASTGARPA